VRTGRPGLGYPWSWGIVPYLPGQVAAETPPADLAAAAVSLGGFLAALHRPAPPDAPVNPFRGVPLAERTDAVLQNLDAVIRRLTCPSVDAAARRLPPGVPGFGAASDTSWAGRLAGHWRWDWYIWRTRRTTRSWPR
jgi:Phosphotransferase enzyme family